MKTIKIYLPVLFFLFSISFAQNKIDVQQADETSILQEKSYPVDAAPLIERFNKAINFDIEKLGRPVMNLKKTAGWNFNLGSTHAWYAMDLRTGASPQFYQVQSTCKKVGTHCYIFVQDSLWNGGRVDQGAVDSVQNAFDLKTPSGSVDPTKGIYDNDVNTFGSPPDVDGDPKIIILILDIRDGYKGTGGYTAGYFHAYNEYTPSQGAPYSNVAEIYYLDGNPLDLKNHSGIVTGMSTTAHEFQHMIHFKYISPAETFFNEGWSEIAEVVNGYSLREQSSFANESNHYLIDWRSGDATAVLKDYSRAARFALYLKEQFSTDILKKYLSNQVNGVSGLNMYMQSVGSRTFSSVLTDWWLANFLNENVGNTHPEWLYTYSPMNKVGPYATYISPNVAAGTTGGLYKYSAEYLTFNSGKNLKINFNTAGNSYIKIKAIKSSASSKVIDDVIPGVDYSVPDFGTTYPTVSFMIYHNNGNDGLIGPTVYSFTSSGTYINNPTEIAYELTQPTGYLQLTQGDSVAVQFDGIAGMRLDSIKVALRGITPLNGGVFEYIGSSSQLGGKKLASFTATSTLSAPPPVINSSSDYPYSNPYPNWVKVDLRANNIDAGKSFSVEFPIGAAYPSSNRVLSTYYQSTGSYHSFSYASTQTTPRWLYYSVQGKDGYIFLFLIRAYVSLFATSVGEPIELLPSSFNISQNYPNPFNPSTIISYTLPKQGNVEIKIFDSLGKEVRSLINEEKNAGKYNIMWDSRDNSGNRVSSGIYFYTIRSGNFVETKKMVLLK